MSIALATPRTDTASVAEGRAHAVAEVGISSPDAGWHRFAQLEQTLIVALEPIAYMDSTAWLDALGSAVLALGNAATGAILLPGAAASWRRIGASPRTGAYESPTHDESTERLGVPHFDGPGDPILWVRDDLAPAPAEPPSSNIAPQRHAIGVRVRTASGAVAALYVRRDPALGALDHHALVAFRALAPAFQAGVNSWMSARASRANVEGMLDTLSDPALLFDIDGTAIHANPAATQLVDATPRLRDEAQRIAWALGAVARRRTRGTGRPASSTAAGEVAIRTVHLGGLMYRLRGSVVGETLLGARPAVLVTVAMSTADPLTDDALRTDYGLTTREIEVARLVAAGLSNNEIAERLGIRYFTARNHVERTLAKLGVTSRHRVGPLLRNEAPESSGSNRAA